MRALIVLLTGLLLTGLAVPANAGHDSIEETGIVLAGSPEPVLGSPCDPGAADPHGVSYDVTGFDGHDFLIVPVISLDVDPVFYDENCESLGNGGAPLDFLGFPEDGQVPAGSVYLYVWGWAGTGTFDLTIE